MAHTMMSIADMVERMLAAGVAADLVVLAVRTAEAARPVEVPVDRSGGNPVDETAEKRRAYDRERKAAERAARKSGGKSGGNPVESPPDTSASRAYSINPSSSQDGNSEKQDKKDSSRNSRGHKIPPDWQPNQQHYAEGAELGLSRSRVNAMAEDMRVWAVANANRQVARKADWNLTFTGWMRRNGKQSTGPPRERPATFASMLADDMRNANGLGPDDHHDDDAPTLDLHPLR